jgi:glycosyltransferase involved in cell wall biosynthesis
VTERQTYWLSRLADVEVEVIAPIACYAFPLSLLSDERGLPDAERWNGILVHRPRFTVVPKMRERDPNFLSRRVLPLVRKICARFPFDVLAAQYFWPDGPAAMRLSRELGVPFSVKGRGPDVLNPARNAAKRSQMIQASRTAGGLLSASRGLKDEMVRLGMPETKIEVHYTGADHDAFHPRRRQGAKEALGLHGPVLLISGNLIPRKGQLQALDALTKIPDATLLIAGRGPDAERVQARIAELSLQHRVRTLGLVDHASMAILNAAADVTILPTTKEGLANAWVESLCCGTPVVTTDVCGAREAVDRPEAGRIVANDPEAIAAAVRELLADPPDPISVALAAEKFSWDRNAFELREHLERVALGGLAEGT